jgi:hypothetical protein
MNADGVEVTIGKLAAVVGRCLKFAIVGLYSEFFYFHEDIRSR